MNKGLKFGFIGLGQCGCNIADEFSKLGYPAIAINTTKTDLAYLQNIPDDLKLIINDGIEGAGKNPEVGEQALIDHIDEVYELIKQSFNNVNKIFVCAGLGGGSGSGMVVTLCKVLIEEQESFNINGNCSIGAIVTLPSDIESGRTKIVALDTYSELSSLDGLTNVFVIDNQKMQKSFSVGIKSKYSFLNQKMAVLLDTINSIVTKSASVSFDSRDLETVLQHPGITIINEITIDRISDLKEDGVLATLLTKGIKNSIFADYGNTDINAVGAAFLFVTPKNKSGVIKEEKIEIMKQYAGNPFDVFYGIYETNNIKDESGSFMLILTGLDYDNITRIQELNDSMEEVANLLSKKTKKKNAVKTNTKASDLLNQLKQKKPEVNKSDITNGNTRVSALDKIRDKKIKNNFK